MDPTKQKHRRPPAQDDDDLELKEGLLQHEESSQDAEFAVKSHSEQRIRRPIVKAVAAIFLILLLLSWFFHPNVEIYIAKHKKCDSIEHGYVCEPTIAQFWGQYSPYFSVASAISDDLPEHCRIDFVQLLSRHGARDPTARKTERYHETVHKIQKHAKIPKHGKYAFLKNYKYKLGADQLNAFGKEELQNSGIKFYNRYRTLAASNTPFVRSSGQERVVDSAEAWIKGFSKTRKHDKAADHSKKFYPQLDLVISEAPGSNNTLNHGNCPAFEDSTTDVDAQKQWADLFTPSIAARLEQDLSGIKLSSSEVIDLLQMCPFDTVSHKRGKISPFCRLFSEEEYHQLNYYESLDKYYGFGAGNLLGPSQGIGWVNELVARMTRDPVEMVGSINRTLDSDPKTFPVGEQYKLFADFSHDNDMTAAFFALGLFTQTPPLSNTSMMDIEETKGFSAAWAVPFAARAYVEKMTCLSDNAGNEDFVRIVLNDRVMPMEQCGGDDLGRCSLEAFLSSLSFAKTGGKWNQC